LNAKSERGIAGREPVHEPDCPQVLSWSFRVRPSPVAIFVLGAVVTASGIGVFARRASGAGDVREEGLALPVDVPTYGFAPTTRVNGVALLEATRDFRMELPNGPVKGAAPDQKHAGAASTILRRELARYPSSFFTKVNLAAVVLASDLVENDTPIPSLPNVARLLLLDVDAAEIDLVRAVHHEIWHFADLADDGVLSPDPTWRALNPPGTFYGSGGRSIRGSWAAKPATNLPGFVSAYATAGDEEDKAETFAFVVARRKLPDDPVVRAKVDLLRVRLASLDADAPTRLGF
jgi:hypothetical protein